MESKIRVLSEQTINQIAAGEVIENGASVIKELVENSLDAGATEICIEIVGGGRQLIRVRDNGSGMNGDDALLCLERHATSKIRQVDDLHTIASMGFRGEALPSIASISKFTLITAPPNEKGTLVSVDGGKIVKTATVECEPGTQIEVKELFFNVPARKKFQKAPAHDVQEILKMVTLLALGHTTVNFELISNQKSLLKTHSENRIADILGPEFLQELTPIESEHQEWQLQGYIGLPACTRHNRSGQFLFINQRPVTSPLVSYAIREGYGPALAQNRHPLFVLHLTLPGGLVDVNVHPQKREVRLRHEQAIREWLVKAVEAALPKPEVFNYVFAPLPEIAPLKLAEEPVRSYVAPPVAVSVPLPLPKPAPLSLRVLTCFPGYFITEMASQNGLNLVDQRASHSRVIFERLLAEEQKIAVQTLLLPHTITLTPVEAALLEPHLEALNRSGISIKPFGGNAYVIDALPQIFGNGDIEGFLHELIKEMSQTSFKQEVKKWIAEIASRTSLSKSRKLSLQEAQLLVNQLMECQTPHTCPRGRPTLVELALTDLTTAFKR